MSEALFPLDLFVSIMKETPAQPATNLWRAVELNALIKHGLPYVQASQSLLDLGCGDGGVMATLRSHLPARLTLIGLDADAAETNLAVQRHLYSTVLTSGAESMPLADKSVDAIISNSVLEHIPPIEKVLSESARVLRSGGWFIATVPGPDFQSCLRGAWLPWVSRQAYLRELDERLVHYRYWTQEEWRNNLGRVGVRMEAAHDYLPLAVVRRWEFLSRITGGLAYQLAGRRKRPIHVQRALRLRRSMTLPFWFAHRVARLLSRGLGDESGPYGGLLVVGRKL